MAGLPLSKERRDVNGAKTTNSSTCVGTNTGIHPNSHTVQAASKMLMIVCPLRSSFRSVTQTEKHTQIAQKVTVPGSAGCHISFS
jgi:hypothetical protein